jgi:hypothetical protein
VRGVRGSAVAALAAVTVAASATVAASGCGGQPAPAAPFGVALQVADCDDWRAAGPQERQSVIDQLEEAVAGPRHEGNTLSDDAAYNTLDARCKPGFAHGFVLYQLYIRAAAFTSYSE